MTKELKRAFLMTLLCSVLFTAAIFFLDPLLDRFSHLPDQGPSWYYWKLPAPAFWARITAWGGYILHQLAIWVIIILAIKKGKMQKNPGPLNYAALAVNGFFIFLHILQTHLFYDGLAQDVSVWSSQYSVIVMLVIVLALLMPRRGLIFGIGKKVPSKALRFLKRFHGLYISWALVYTFWFHPTEGDYAILLGFFYMFLLLTQLSFFNTPLHVNILWITILEVFVGVHGTAVAIMNQQEIWPMFLFGFLFMFIATQINGFKIPFPAKLIVSGVYIVGLLTAYFFRGYHRLYELSFIPVTLYLGALAVLGFSAFTNFFRRKRA